MDIDDNEKSFTLKFIVIGDSNVGKTTLLQNFTDLELLSNDNNKNIKPTHGLDTFFTEFITEKSESIKLELIDTAGTERYNSINMCKSLYNDADGVIVVYDTTNVESFENVKNKWINRIRVVMPEYADHKLIIVANKIDLIKERLVSIEDGVALTQTYKLPYVMISSFQRDTLHIPFKYLIDNIFAFENKYKIMARKEYRFKTISPPIILSSSSSSSSQYYNSINHNDKNKEKKCIECS